ncbi:MAG: hypothetical protein J7L92_01150 [Dehalococcoidia bacterium]|nr:hypothetical protein [Dehalococcoidia bacterium]
MKTVITSTLLATVLVLVISSSALGNESESITITMTGVNEISISLDKTQWPLGEVAADTEYMTNPPIEWCTLAVEGNCNVNTFIVGEDAEWVNNPGDYKWTLSNDGTNEENVYGLLFRISGDTERGYVPITKTEDEFWPPPSGGSSLAPGDIKQFGLKLLTPTYFVGGREMQTQITISAVAD